MAYIFLLLGFVLLIKGADLFVDGAAGVAGWLRVPAVIIGLTIVAMGTSAPEMSVSIVGALKGQSGISVGNIVGSNLFNLLCVGGLAALIMPMTVNTLLVKRDIPISLLVAVIFTVFTLGGMLTRFAGILFLVVFAFFLFFMFRDARKARTETTEVAKDLPPVAKCIIFIVIGLAGVVLGGELVVRSATKIAYHFGLSSSLVGLTIVALGTSLPELMTTLVAAKKGESDIAIGNIIGSNIFNIGLVLGVSATLHPMPIESFVLVDALFLCAVTLLLLAFLWKEKKLRRWQGLVCFLLYVAYLTYIIIRG